jgi:hypothetical protein
MAARSLRNIAWLLLLLCQGAQAQSILQRQVDVHAGRVPLAEALALVARDGRFKLSYNAALINGDSSVQVEIKSSVKQALRQLTGDRLLLKESGEHIILLDNGGAKDPVQLRGMVRNAVDGSPVARATVYELREKAATRTDGNGAFVLEATGKRDPVPLLLACTDFRDTVVYVPRDAPPASFTLRPVARLDRLEPLCLNQRCVTLDELGLARLLVPQEQMGQAANLGLGERRDWQLSLVPSVGTNGPISGAVVNRWSFNVLAGYSRGLDGFELGGVANLERQDVKGVQIAGVANLVGRDTRGVQIAGVFSHTLHALEGLQLSGVANTVWDTLTGVQVAGGVNVVKGGMLGAQVAGLGNLTTQNCDGAQVAGAFNVAVKDVRKTQVGGALNYGRNVYGTQVAGAMNMVLGEVGGGQVAGALNLARKVTGGQVAGGLNVAVDTVRGGQVGVVNIGRVVVGAQVGILNFSDTIMGTSFGLFSFARRGYHRLDVVHTDLMPLTVVLRTGTRHVYNVLSASPPVQASGAWAYGYGFGSERRAGTHGALNIELTADHLNEQEEWIGAVNLVGRFTVAYAHTFGKRIVLSAGPAFNLLVSDWRNRETGEWRSALPPRDPWVRGTEGNVLLAGWLGYAAGIGVRF